MVQCLVLFHLLRVIYSNYTNVLFSFDLQVKLGKNGVEEIYGLGTLSDYEQKGLEALKGELKASIEKGIEFASKN